MNMLAIKGTAPLTNLQTVKGAGEKTNSQPFGLFASLLDGLQDAVGEGDQTNNLKLANLDALLAELDQLLSFIGEEEEKNNEAQLFDLIDPNMVMADSLLPTLPPEAEILLHLFGNELLGIAGFDGGVYNEGNGNQLPVALHKIGSVLQNPLLQPQSENSRVGQNAQNIASKFQELPSAVQYDLLNTLRAILQAAKDEKTAIGRNQIDKIGLFLQQIGNEVVAQKSELNPSLDVKTGTTFIFDNAAPDRFTVKTPLEQMITAVEERSGSQTENHKPQDGSPQSIKVGFHQLMGAVSAHSLQPAKQTGGTVIRAQNFQKDMNEFLIRQIQMTRFPNGASEARIKLFPENLGNIEVKLSIHQGVVTAQFIADSHAGKELLESHLAGLRNSFIQQGLQVEKIEVQVPNQQNSGQNYDANARQEQGHREQPRNQSHQELNENFDQEFAELFETFSQHV